MCRQIPALYMWLASVLNRYLLYVIHILRYYFLILNCYDFWLFQFITLFYYIRFWIRLFPVFPAISPPAPNPHPGPPTTGLSDYGNAWGTSTWKNRRLLIFRVRGNANSFHMASEINLMGKWSSGENPSPSLPRPVLVWLCFAATINANFPEYFSREVSEA